MKVAKFGGTSLADAGQIRKVIEITKADPERRIIVVSAPGKRTKDDIKVTDLLIACAKAMLARGEAEKELGAVVGRFAEIQRELELPESLTREIEADLRRRLARDRSHAAAFTDCLKAAGEDNCAKVVAAAFVRGAKALGFKVVVVTNQPGIAKNTLTVAELNAVNARVAELLKKGRATWAALEYCPHHPDGDRKCRAKYVKNCTCRKPKPGLILRAARKLGVDVKRSWMIGDGLNDVQAGRAAGCRTIWVGRMKPEHVERFFGSRKCEPDAAASDLAGALRIIKEAEAS